MISYLEIIAYSQKSMNRLKLLLFIIYITVMTLKTSTAQEEETSIFRFIIYFSVQCKCSTVNHKTIHNTKGFIKTRRYGQLRGLTSSSCGGLRPSAEAFFCPLGKQTAYYDVLANFLAIFGVQSQPYDPCK